MKKLLCLIVSIAIATTGCSKPLDLSQKDLGELLLFDPVSDDVSPTKGILILNPQTNEKKFTPNTHRLSNLFFSEDKTKFIGVGELAKIIEYNLNDKKYNVIFDGGEDNRYSHAKYVPNSTFISYVDIDRLILVNLVNKESVFVTELQGQYSWTKDGKSLYYSSDGIIYKWNRLTHKTVKVMYGGGPQLSLSNKMLAYFSDEYLTIKNLESGEKWRYKTREILSYKFSPDDNYVAILQGNTSIKYIYGQELLIWDLKSGKKQKLIKHISQGVVGDFDWR